ncbi:hypothetical protein BH11PSE10_BH11PSE10_13620 [soil metagenome]
MNVAVFESRPWPVVLMTALGAWLAAVPLTMVIFMLLEPVLRDGPGPYVIGALLLAGSVAVLRRHSLPLFVEQLAVPGLLVGGLCLGHALFKDTSRLTAALLLALLALAVAAAVARPWLRMLLGTAAAALAWVAADARWVGEPRANWLGVYGLIAAWALALAAQGRVRPFWAALIEDSAAGWLLGALLLLCFSASATTFLGSGWAFIAGMKPWVSAGAAIVGALWAARAWPGLRQPWLLAVALVLIVLAVLMPALGAALFALAVVTCSQRWRLAAAAALAAAWIVGSFYYQLHWPLAQKALWLTGAGVLLGGLAAWRMRGGTRVQAGTPGKSGPRPAVFIAGALLTLIVANGAIWQKEQLIAEGRPVFVALAPVDPRSLMQGDYMRLRFALPEEVSAPLVGWDETHRPHLTARLDARRVATLLRLNDAAAPLDEGEILLQLTPKDGRWILVTDAWFFREGEAARFAAARFGEFRVLPDGRALLVGVADQNLQPIRP